MRSRLGAPLLLLALAAALPVAAITLLSTSAQAPIDGHMHMMVMALGSSVAAAVSFVLMGSGVRLRDGRAILSGGAFAAMTLLMAIHGFSTPGVMMGPNGMVAIAGGAALPVGAALLALSAIPAVRAPERLRLVVLALIGLLAFIVLATAAALTWPDDLPSLPRTGSTLAAVLMTVGLVLFGIVFARASRTYILTRRGSDLLVVVGVVWLAAALVPTLMLPMGTYAWWMGHVLEFSGLALVALPVALDLRRGRPSRPLIGDMVAGDLVATQEVFVGAHVRSLLVAMGEKDRSTEEHIRRVARLAVALGETLGLAQGRLRELALGGLLHDVGKLSVPSAILKKPGKLSDREMAVIQRHSAAGDEMLAELGYSARLRRMVRGHHERLDGSGYPDGLAGERLDFETRILAVADVYDALVSPRVYRGAWTPEKALALLRSEAGTTFDSQVVSALQRLVRSGAPVTVAPAPPAPEAQLRAA